MLNENYKDTSLINSYAEQLKSALQQLNYKNFEHEIESIAVFLVRAMGAELRNYHKPEHSIDVSKNLPAISRIAALFHDVVYVQVDPQWKTFLGSILYPMIPNDSLSLNVKDALNQTMNPWFKTVAVVFGVENLEKLQPSSGLNEFLSAIVVINKLQHILNPKDLVKVVSCIEATIPFRKIDSLGNTPSKRLKERLIRASQEFKLNLDDADINRTALDCRDIVENDLSGFRSEDLSRFLSDSWNVLSENDSTLRNSFFLVSDYRKAVFGLIGFFQMLDPDHMFWSDVTPSNPKSSRYKERARYNLRNGSEYMKAFYLSLSLVEAIAVETGGDAPYEYFIGAKKSSREHNPPEISNFIKLDPEPKFNSEEEADIYEVLLFGRQVRAKFDRKYCPLGAYLYYYFTKEGIFEDLYQGAVMYHKGELKGVDFLKKFPKNHLSDVIVGISKLATIRAEKILELNK
jgi:hypothetical protein